MAMSQNPGIVGTPNRWFMPVYSPMAVIGFDPSPYGYGSKLGTPIIGWLILN